MRRVVMYLSCLVMLAAPGAVGITRANSQPAPGTLDFDPTNPPTQTLVMRGETLFNIAERTRAPIEGLIRVNGLTPPFAIQPGQVLRLPPLKVHVVASGETFTAIAARYNVDERSLAVFNRLSRPVKVRVDQRVILPPLVVDRLTGLEPQDLVDLLANEIAAGRGVTGSIPGQIIANSEAVATQAPTPNTAPDTISPPRARPVFGPSSDGLDDVIGANPFTTPSSFIGPTEDGQGVGVRPLRSLPATKTTARRAQLAALSPTPIRPRAGTSPPPSPAISNALPSITDMPTSNLAGLFGWPIAGRVIETFGAKRDLRILDGIEIEAPAGAPFKSAAGGIVVYVGNQLPGYGWLVLIKHTGGLMSAYAYAQSVNVRENQTVSKGQIIGLIGTTGRAITPRLHFQIRHNTHPIDPLPRLPRISGAA